jgi:hypothetical protein
MADQPGPLPPPEFISSSELCRRLGICRRTIVNHGLRRFAVRVGAQWRYDWPRVLQHYAGLTEPRPG